MPRNQMTKVVVSVRKRVTSLANVPKKGEDRPKKGCFKCGEEGHSKADCTNEAKDGGGDKRGCFKCKSQDHMASECELPDTCRKCKKEGHMAADCELPDKCYKCRKEGHMAADC